MVLSYYEQFFGLCKPLFKYKCFETSFLLASRAMQPFRLRLDKHQILFKHCLGKQKKCSVCNRLTIVFPSYFNICTYLLLINELLFIYLSQ